MMRVTIDVIPFGDEGAARTIAEVEVWNTSELAPVSNYEAELRQDGKRIGVGVDGHRRADGWIPLVRRVLENLEIETRAMQLKGTDTDTKGT